MVSEGRLRILFCDLCDESVPQGDLEAGRAVRRNGRLVCGACERAMSVAGAPAVTEASPEASSARDAPAAGARRRAPEARLALTLACVALLVAGGAAGSLFLGMRAREAALRAELAAEREATASANRALERRLEDAVDRARVEVAFERGNAEQRERARGEREEARREELAVLRGGFGRLEDRVASLEASLRSAGPQRSAGDAELRAVREATDGLRAALARLEEKLATLERRGDEVAGAAAEPDAGLEPGEAQLPAWREHVAALDDGSASRRWQAVQALGKSGDPEAAEYLAPRLKDPDLFVRMATARILGELGAPTAIPALIDGLEDREASVREAAAGGLRTLSGRDFRFDAGAKLPQRLRAVKAWREWWKRAAPEFLSGE